MHHRNIILIGAGPAGLTAGYFCSYFGFDTLIFEDSRLFLFLFRF